MPYAKAKKYHDCIDTIVAEKALMDLSIVSNPHKEESDRKKFRKMLSKMANKFKPEKKLSFKEFAQKASRELGSSG